MVKTKDEHNFCVRILIKTSAKQIAVVSLFLNEPNYRKYLKLDYHSLKWKMASTGNLGLLTLMMKTQNEHVHKV